MSNLRKDATTYWYRFDLSGWKQRGSSLGANLVARLSFQSRVAQLLAAVAIKKISWQQCKPWHLVLHGAAQVVAVSSLGQYTVPKNLTMCLNISLALSRRAPSYELPNILSISFISVWGPFVAAITDPDSFSEAVTQHSFFRESLHWGSNC